MARILLLSFLLATGLQQGKEAAQGRTDQQRGAPAAAERRTTAAAATPAVWKWFIPVQTAQEDLRQMVRLNMPGQAPGALLGGAVVLLMAGLLVGRRPA